MGVRSDVRRKGGGGRARQKEKGGEEEAGEMAIAGCVRWIEGLT